MPYLGIYWAPILKDLLSYLKSRTLVFVKYQEIMKMPKFGAKIALFGYFWARILKRYCHI